jgi:hypothetical protein
MTLARRRLPASRPALDRGATHAPFRSIRPKIHDGSGPEILGPDPIGAVERLAPHIFVLSMASPDLLICQAAGRTARIFLGLDAKGKNFHDLWTEASQKTLRRYFTISARKHRAFFALSSSRPSATVLESCTLFVPGCSADNIGKRFIAITFRIGRRAPGVKSPDRMHLHHAAFFQAQATGEEKTSQSFF